MKEIELHTFPPKVTLPPSSGSRAPSGSPCASPAGRPGSRSACSPSPWRSRHRQCGRSDGRENNADPGASGGETSSYLEKQINQKIKRAHLKHDHGSRTVIQFLQHFNTCIRRFVDQHGVHGHDVGPSETLHVLQDLLHRKRHKVLPAELSPNINHESGIDFICTSF